MKTWKRRHSLNPWMKKAHGWSVDLAPWDAWLGEVSLKDFFSTKANPCQDVIAKGFKDHTIV